MLKVTIPTLWNEVMFIRGDKAMWIVLWVATIASMRAMGLAFAPVETDKERGPYSDM
jgi:hypothetical protein